MLAKAFTFVYEYFFKELDILFPLSGFEGCMLIVMNVAPTFSSPMKEEVLSSSSHC